MHKIYSDESIHSYLIRILMRMGALESPSALRGIISSSGVVWAIPNILIQHAPYLAQLYGNSKERSISKYAKEVLCQSNANTQQVNSNFDVYVYDFYDFSSNMSLVGRTQLRFCSDCFKEQIQAEGIVWFKFDWLFAEHCDEHNKLMTEVSRDDCLCRLKMSNNILTQLKSAMTGYCLTCGENIWCKSVSLLRKTNGCSGHMQNYLFHSVSYKRQNLAGMLQSADEQLQLVQKKLNSYLQ